MGKNGKLKGGYRNRQEQEAGEGMTTIVSEAPAGRVQTEGQIATAMDASDVKTAAPSGPTIKVDAVPAQVVHTKKVASVKKDVNGLTSGQGSFGGLSLRSGSYSGNTDIAGDMSATPTLGKADRSATRTGKKLDSTLKKINYLYNEQVIVEYDESKPLAEEPDATQGYNGTYRNEHARTQKRSGFTPADLYYDRSIDEIHQDFIYPIMGQSINDPAAQLIPSYNTETGEYDGFELHRGNHLHTALNVTFDANGAITGFNFGDFDITPTKQDVDVANVSALNAIIDANQAEIDRQNMDKNAGDEMSPKFSPLPRSIAAPTDTIALLRDIEASCGAEVFMAYKKTAAAMSYQLNKAAKDGQRLDTPINEMLSGCMKDGTIYDRTVVGSYKTYTSPFTKANYQAGSPALIIAIFDSVGKYSTKGDYLLQPRGFRMHLQTADNNMNVLRVPRNFVNAVNSNEVFSTIDSEYDPFLPVCVSDKASLAHPYSLNTFIADNKPKAFVYKYTNNSNNVYSTQVYHPLVRGLYEFFSTYGPKIVSKDILNGAGTISIPCMHSTTSFSLWSLILLAATPFIVKARLTSLIDIFDYEENFGYPFAQLESLAEANPMAAKNYKNPDYNEPLQVGRMSTATAFKWVLPETYWIHDEDANSAEIVMPWYHNELQYEVDSNNKIALSSDPCVMSMPSIRSGSRLGFLDTIYSMSERDVRLCLDRQTVYPCYKMNSNAEFKVYKYGLTTDGQIVVTLNNSDFTYQNILRTPREIGWVIPALNGMLTQLVYDFTDAANFKTKRVAYNDSIETYAPGSFRVRYWQGLLGSGQKTPTDILQADSVNINRAASLCQEFKAIINQRMDGDYRTYTTSDVILSCAAMFDATAANPTTVNNRSYYKPFTINGAASTAGGDKVVALHKYFWTRVQRLPFAINPFDCSPEKKNTGSDDSVKTDPYDFLYVFGCAGFRGSDYNEDSYNREKQRLNLGMLFLEDPYFKDSLAYRAE